MIYMVPDFTSTALRSYLHAFTYAKFVILSEICI